MQDSSNYSIDHIVILCMVWTVLKLHLFCNYCIIFIDFMAIRK